MAHFEDGAALAAYRQDPYLDLHQWAADYINTNLGLGISRKQTKTCSFAILYGSGLTTLAAQMGGTYDEAAQVKQAYLDALPGLQSLIDGLKGRARQKEPFKTWGGRVYYCEEPKFMEGRWRTFDYKMVNYLIQGSSADISKEAVIRYHRAKKHGRILLMVHDEICVSCPRQHWQEEMAILKDCMEGIELDAKLVSDGEVGFNWHDLVPEVKYA
jgi:DNA polymerase-1